MLAIAQEVYAVWFSNIWLWLKLSVVPLIAAVGVSLLVAPDGEGPAKPELDLSWSIIWLIYLTQIPQATAWHRVILQPDRTDGHRYMFGWNERLYFLKLMVLCFFLFGLILLAGILIAFLGPMIPSSPIFQMVGFTFVVLGLAYLGVGYFMCPILLMFPAASIGKKLSSGEAYMIVRKSRNNARLAIAYLLVSVPVIFVNWVATRIAEQLNTANDFLANLLLFTPDVLYAPALVGVISITYRELVQKPGAATRAGPAAGT